MTGILSFKVALCLSYLRILPKFWTFYRRVIIFVLISCVLEHIGAILVLLLQCLPVRKFWERDYPGHCLPDDPAFHILAGFTIAYDFVIMLLPMPILYSLQISTQRKIALIGVFSLGIFTTFCSIMRIVNIENGSYDYQTMVVVWACIEVMVGVCFSPDTRHLHADRAGHDCLPSNPYPTDQARQGEDVQILVHERQSYHRNDSTENQQQARKPTDEHKGQLERQR